MIMMRPDPWSALTHCANAPHARWTSRLVLALTVTLCCACGPTQGSLYSAARDGNRSQVQKLLDEAASSDQRYARWEMQRALATAVDARDPEMTRALLAGGADPNKPGWEEAPIVLALRGSKTELNAEILRLLIDHGAHLPEKVLLWAVGGEEGNSNVEVLATLIRAGADPTRKFDYRYWEIGPFELGSINNELKVVVLGDEAFLSPQTRISGTMSTKEFISGKGSILFLAAVHGDRVAVEFFLSQGIDPTAKDDAGRPPAVVARKAGQEEIAAFLERSSIVKRTPAR